MPWSRWQPQLLPVPSRPRCRSCFCLGRELPGSRWQEHAGGARWPTEPVGRADRRRRASGRLIDCLAPPERGRVLRTHAAETRAAGTTGRVDVLAETHAAETRAEARAGEARATETRAAETCAARHATDEAEAPSKSLHQTEPHRNSSRWSCSSRQSAPGGGAGKGSTGRSKRRNNRRGRWRRMKKTST